MKPRFIITYQTVTDDSASVGDAAHHGFLPRSAQVPLYRNNFPKRPALFTLKQVVDLLQPAGRAPCEADSAPCVTLSVHFDDVSDASARRVAKLLNCYGLTP